jgi:uncharacterized membrane protein
LENIVGQTWYTVSSMKWHVSSRAKLGLALGGSSLVSVCFWAAGAVSNRSGEYSYLVWNLFLAWLPLLFAVWIERSLRVRLWSNWSALCITLLWLGFLPNSFYVITDFVHLGELPRVDIVFDVVMIGSFVLNALILGYLSLFIVHTELRKRVSAAMAGMVIAAVLLLSSFAIYIGRDLRWNTWDVIVNPASILFDVSDRVINAHANPQIFSTTISFFVLLGMVYLIIWHALGVLRQQKKPL